MTLKGGSPQAPFDRRLMTDDDGLKRERFKQIVDSEAPAWGLAAECFPDSSMAKGSPKESFKRLCGSLAKRICDRVLLPREFGTGALPHGPWQVCAATYTAVWKSSVSRVSRGIRPTLLVLIVWCLFRVTFVFCIPVQYCFIFYFVTITSLVRVRAEACCLCCYINCARRRMCSSLCVHIIYCVVYWLRAENVKK